MITVRNAIRTLRRTLRGDDGVSLMEMVVSMAIGSMLLAAVGALTVKMIGYLDNQDKRNATTLQTATAMDLVAKQVRTTYKPSTRPAIIIAAPETYGFYANLNSLPVGAAANPAATPITFTPQEVWIWTEVVGSRERLCDQVRPLSLNAAGTVVFPALDLSIQKNRTCHEIVTNLSATTADGSSAPSTFRYLDADDPIGASGLSRSSIVVTAAGNVADTTDVEAVEISVAVNAGTRKRPVVVTTTDRITFVNPQN